MVTGSKAGLYQNAQSAPYLPLTLRAILYVLYTMETAWEKLIKSVILLYFELHTDKMYFIGTF